MLPAAPASSSPAPSRWRRGGTSGVRRLEGAAAAWREPYCVVRDVAKLLKCYGREFGWRLGRPELAKWASLIATARAEPPDAEDVRSTEVSVEGGPEEQKGPWRVASTRATRKTEFRLFCSAQNNSTRKTRNGASATASRSPSPSPCR